MSVLANSASIQPRTSLPKFLENKGARVLKGSKWQCRGHKLVLPPPPPRPLDICHPEASGETWGFVKIRFNRLKTFPSAIYKSSVRLFLKNGQVLSSFGLQPQSTKRTGSSTSAAKLTLPLPARPSWKS